MCPNFLSQVSQLGQHRAATGLLDGRGRCGTFWRGICAAFRAERGLSQEPLAHESGINRTYLSGVERSERNVSIDNIARIARGLKVKPWTLLDDSVK